ncbi:amidohydrolase family protein [Glutamicibacter sp.]|uniref:amidohydrolase n=1 Tax=Glutamicibacter sp. TaxID=1931995 RepID=UPI0028BF3D45|nr:amidohydrolase family protein [Glutamicibacter sp.]
MNADLIISARAIINPLAPATSDTTVAISDGIITAVGGGELVEAAAPTAEHITFDGVLLPGLVDIHTHPIWGSIERGMSLDLIEVHTKDDLLQATAQRIEELGSGQWITGFNLDINVFGAEVTGAFFEEHFPGAKISYMTTDAHALVVSPAIIAELGITGAEQFADASQIVVDAHGAPTGYILELQAMDLIMEHYPAPSTEQAAGYVLHELNAMAASGLTQIHALDFAHPSEDVLRYLDDRKLLPLTVRCSPLIPADSTIEQWQQALELQGLGGERWQVAGVKFMLDGTADNGSAWFHSPDCLGQNTHSLWRDPQAYKQAVEFFASHQVPTATHAIGDAAVAFALDVLEAAGPVAGGAHRIEHLESIGDELLGRFAQLGVIASVQPVHGTRLTSPDGSDNWSVRLGAERAAHGWRTKDLLDAGAPLALGSDWPIGIADPRVALADAQLRRPVERPEQDTLHAEQAVSAAAAYHCMTRVPALATAQPLGGLITAGAPADLSIFAADPLGLTPEEQSTNPVLATVVAGTLHNH